MHSQVSSLIVNRHKRITLQCNLLENEHNYKQLKIFEASFLRIGLASHLFQASS